MLHPDWISVDEVEERFNAQVKPSLESMLEVVSGTLRSLPELFAELRRLDVENDRLRAERDAVVALVVKHYNTEGRPHWWPVVGITGQRDPAAAVRVAAGLEPGETPCVASPTPT